jgi:hypothetical protein
MSTNLRSPPSKIIYDHVPGNPRLLDVELRRASQYMRMSTLSDEVDSYDTTKNKCDRLAFFLANSNTVNYIMKDMGHAKTGLEAYLKSTGDPELYRPIVKNEIRVRQAKYFRSSK